MNNIVENARTIEEKVDGYSGSQNIDYTYFEEWRNVRTLLNDKYFNVMLKEMGLSKDEFAYSLQPSGGTILSIQDNWFDIFLEIMDSFEYDEIDYNVGVNLPTLPFNRYFFKELKKVISDLKNIKVSDKVLV